MVYFEYEGLRIPWYRRPPIEIWRRLRQIIYTRDGGLCCYCHNPVRLEDCHIHHVLELSEGGTNQPTNLKTLCVKCHKTRHPFMRSPRDKLRELV
jgi:5-methylcytosine-specific restriction endonuclease McrA